MKNTLSDLNNILFAQLERLADDDLSDEAIALEVQRTQSVVSIADRIVSTAQIQLSGARFLADHAGARSSLPATLGLSAGGAS